MNKPSARSEFREQLEKDYRARFEKLFGSPCEDKWLAGWREAIAYLREQDRRARTLRSGSVESARRFLEGIGVVPDSTPPPMTAHTFALRVEVEEAIAARRSTLSKVGELPRDLPKLTASGIDAVILFFESHSTQTGRARWLTDKELAVVSLLLDPERIRLGAGDLESNVSPAIVLEEETKAIRRSRKFIGELRTPTDKRRAAESAGGKERPRLKEVPGWLDEIRRQST